MQHYDNAQFLLQESKNAFAYLMNMAIGEPPATNTAKMIQRNTRKRYK